MNKKEIETCVARARQLAARIASDGWLLGREYARLMEAKAHLAFGFADLRTFFRKKVGVSYQYALRLARASTEFSQIEFARYGAKKLNAALRFPRGERRVRLKTGNLQSSSRPGGPLRRMTKPLLASDGSLVRSLRTPASQEFDFGSHTVIAAIDWAEDGSLKMSVELKNNDLKPLRWTPDMLVFVKKALRHAASLEAACLRASSEFGVPVPESKLRSAFYSAGLGNPSKYLKAS